MKKPISILCALIVLSFCIQYKYNAEPAALQHSSIVQVAENGGAGCF